MDDVTIGMLLSHSAGFQRTHGAAVIAAFNPRNDARPEESAAGFRAVRDAALALIAR
jgi:hypothetical protein